MLEFELPNTSPLLREGITCKLETSRVQIEDLIEAIDYCFCSFECEENLLAFAGVKEREKDFFTLYYKSKDESATINFFIDDIQLVNDTYGEVIDNGYIVDFTKVFNELGGGLYTLKIEITEFGNTFEKTYGKFEVAPYNQERADGTVRLLSIQSGNIESSFDFGREGVPFMLRFPGILTNRQKVDELKQNQNSNRVEIQVHDRWWYEYELILETNRQKFANFILNTLLPGTELYVSDYNLTNETREEPYNNIRVRQVETSIEHIKGTNTSVYVIKLEDGIKRNIKHPFFEN